jgi:hypothetical protein
MLIRSLAIAVLALTGCSATIGGESPPPGDDQPGDPGPDASCPAVHFTASQTNPSVQLLIDRSGSMSTNLPNTNTSRYQAVHDGLVGANGVVAALQNKAYFGAALFSSDNPCPMLYKSNPRQMGNLTSIKSLIESQGPNGNTPTPPAIDATVADFVAHPAPQGSPPVIVLATDGLPNSCADGNQDTSAQSVTAAKNAYAAGIRVFVLGIAGVNDAFLQSVANAGVGVQANQPNAPYYTANSPQQLKDAFNQIIGGVLSCDLALNGTIDPDQASSGTVSLNGMQLTYGTDWKIVGGTTLELLGTACDTLKNSAMPQVDATFSCGATLF